MQKAEAFTYLLSVSTMRLPFYVVAHSKNEFASYASGSSHAARLQTDWRLSSPEWTEVSCEWFDTPAEHSSIHCLALSVNK